jgi:hypothetical protein
MTPEHHLPEGLAHDALEQKFSFERVHPPPDFARDLARDIALKAHLEGSRLTAPPGFAALAAARIHADAAESPLCALEPVRAPPGFAQAMATRIARDADAFPLLETAPRVSAPVGFASQLATRIQTDAVQLPALRALPRLSAPPHFARTVAERIALEAAPEFAPNDRAPLYFIAALLGGAAVALLSLTWPYASVAGSALLETLRILPNAMLAPVLAVMVLAVVGALTPNRRVRLPVALGAFAVAAVGVIPQALPFFGSAQVGGIAGAAPASIVRFAGDVVVNGSVDGDVIVVGGSVRLTPGASVSGRVLTFLGDINLSPRASVGSNISAVLGTLNDPQSVAATQAQSATLPGMSAASALRPVRALVTSGTWQWWYLGLLVALGGALTLLPSLRQALHRPLQLEAGRSLSLGLLLLLLTGPAVAIGGLSLIGAPAALLLGVFTLLVYSSGAALVLSDLGAGVLRLMGQSRPGLWRIVPGFALFGLALLFPPLALALWLLFGAWGAGALLIALRDGSLTSSFEG